MYSDRYWASFKINSLGPSGLMEKFSQKKYIFSRWKTILVNFFSYYRVWQTSGNILLGSTWYYGIRCASYLIIFVTPNRLLKTQFFEKKRLFFRRKSFFRPIFLVFSSTTDVSEQFISVHNVFWQVWGKLYDHFFRTYEVDGKKFSKKGYFPDEKQIWSIFSRFTEYGRPQETFY